MPVEHASEEKKSRIKRQVETNQKEDHKARPAGDNRDPGQTVAALQSMVGNRAVQRLLAQRSGDEPYELDQETETNINSQRGSGQQLDPLVWAAAICRLLFLRLHLRLGCRSQGSRRGL